MNRKGVCKESDWPYTVSKFNEKPPQSAYAAAKGNNLCKYERLYQDIDQFRACLKDKCLFVFGFKVYKSFIDSTNGYMPMPSRQEQLGEPLGRHAVLAVGYDNSKRCIKVLNSWGSRWGDNGYFYMPYQFIENSSLCFDFWKISFACEKGKPHLKDFLPPDSIVGPCGINLLQNMSEASGYGGLGTSQCNFLGLNFPIPAESIHDNSGAFGYGHYPSPCRVNPRARNYQDQFDDPPQFMHSLQDADYGHHQPFRKAGWFGKPDNDVWKL